MEDRLSAEYHTLREDRDEPELPPPRLSGRYRPDEPIASTPTGPEAILQGVSTVAHKLGRLLPINTPVYCQTGSLFALKSPGIGATVVSPCIQLPSAILARSPSLCYPYKRRTPSMESGISLQTRR